MKVGKLLKDPKHWIGWFLTTLILVMTFSLIPPTLMESVVTITLIVLVIVVAVDIFKHQVGLQ